MTARLCVNIYHATRTWTFWLMKRRDKGNDMALSIPATTNNVSSQLFGCPEFTQRVPAQRAFADSRTDRRVSLSRSAISEGFSFSSKTGRDSVEPQSHRE